MADAPTMGFEFAYNLNGANSTPVERPMATDGGTYKRGDLMVLSSGLLTKCAANAALFTAVMAEDVPAAAVSGDIYNAYVLQPGQVWRCSADAATQAGNVGVATINIADENTIDATPATGGHLVLVEARGPDSAGNAVTYVCFEAAYLSFA